jgi:predicted Ser/Thr protein kinase
VLEEKQVSEQSLQEELTEKLERLQEEKDTIEHSLREEIESIKAKAEEEYQASPLDYYVMHSKFWNDHFSYSSGGNCAGSS